MPSPHVSRHPGASMALSGMGQCGAEEDCLHSHHQHQHQQQHQRRGTGSSGLHTRARARTHSARVFIKYQPPPRAIEDQAAAWLLALLAGQYLSIAAPMTPLSELITDMGLFDAAMQGLRAERREQVVSDGRERGRCCASMQGVIA